jgi:hypothetical protein
MCRLSKCHSFERREIQTLHCFTLFNAYSSQVFIFERVTYFKKSKCEFCIETGILESKLDSEQVFLIISLDMYVQHEAKYSTENWSFSLDRSWLGLQLLTNKLNTKKYK